MTDKHALTAEAELDEIQQGIAAVQIMEALHCYGLEFVQGVITQWQQSPALTCDQCLRWNQRCQGYCQLRAQAELPQLSKTHAQSCPYFRDIGF